MTRCAFCSFLSLRRPDEEEDDELDDGDLTRERWWRVFSFLRVDCSGMVRCLICGGGVCAARWVPDPWRPPKLSRRAFPGRRL
eukprot:2276610-Heterocapsa_arctica.AAC.1